VLAPSVDRQEGPVVLIHNVFSTFILLGRTRLLHDLLLALMQRSVIRRAFVRYQGYSRGFP
jgi:hypothetical protein